MMRLTLIGIGAGVAAALLFASVASGALLSVVLFYLAPLPILIAALGWSHWAALIAAVTAAAGLAAFLSPLFFITFLIGIGLPAWWLGYLSLLATPGADAPGGMEWYPVGRIVVWAAILGAMVVIAAIPNFGLDEDSFRAGLRKVFERMLQAQSRAADAPLEHSGRRRNQARQFPGGRDPARRRDPRHHHQPSQSVACRPHRERLRPAQTALAEPARHAIPTLRPGLARCRDRGNVPARHCRDSCEHSRGQPCDGLRRSRFRRAACDHAQRQGAAASARHVLCRGLSSSAGRSCSSPCSASPTPFSHFAVKSRGRTNRINTYKE